MLRGRKLSRLLALGLVTAATAPGTTVATTAPAATTSATAPDLGANVTVFDPGMPVAQIQARLDATYAKQVDNEMGSARYAFLFKPGTYGTLAQPLQIKVGYYTEIAGLGASPTDVSINGKVEVSPGTRPGRPVTGRRWSGRAGQLVGGDVVHPDHGQVHRHPRRRARTPASATSSS